MNLNLQVGSPAHSSTPKQTHTYTSKKKQMSSRMENGSHVEAKNGSMSVQRTVVEKSYTTSNRNRSYSSESKTVPSSYQLRFGARSRAVGWMAGAKTGYRRVGGYESRVTVSDGLELTPNLITSRAEEKAALGSLNDRFVSYIDKVRGLVNRNQILEVKVKQLESCQITPSRAGDLYEEQLHKLQLELEKAVSEKTQVEIDLEGCYREMDQLQKRLEREIEDRKDAENEAKSLCKDVDQATLVRVELEGKVESLREELDLIRRASDEDIRVLTDQLASMRTGDVVVDGSQTTDLSESLREIRSAYDQLTQNNKFEIENYYKTKITDLTSQLNDENSSNKNYKADIMDTRRQLQSVTVELETLRTSNAALENQLEDSENRYHTEILQYQNQLAEREKELNDARDKVQRQLVDYNELLNVKLSLDLEIQTYRKLLEGEENRIFVQGATDLNGSSQVTVETRVVTVEQTKGVQRKNGKGGASSSSSSDSESEI